MPSEFAQNAGKAAQDIFSATLWYQTLPYPGAKEYYDKFVKRYSMDTEYHGAEAYASAYVIADTLKRTKALTPADVRESLSKTDLMTVFGPVKFVAYEKMTNQNKLPTYLVQWTPKPQNPKISRIYRENYIKIILIIKWKKIKKFTTLKSNLKVK